MGWELQSRSPPVQGTRGRTQAGLLLPQARAESVFEVALALGRAFNSTDASGRPLR